MGWTVILNKKVIKNIEKHPRIKDIVNNLLDDLEREGPVLKDWPHYSKLEKDLYHCHLRRGRPTYVAVWQVKDKKVYLIEVIYAGTHEKAPYWKSSR